MVVNQMKIYQIIAKFGVEEHNKWLMPLFSYLEYCIYNVADK